MKTEKLPHCHLFLSHSITSHASAREEEGGWGGRSLASSGLQLLLLLVLLQEGRRAELLLLLAVGRLGGRALRGERHLLDGVAGPQRRRGALVAGRQLADAPRQLLVHAAVPAVEQAVASVVLWGVGGEERGGRHR